MQRRNFMKHSAGVLYLACAGTTFGLPRLAFAEDSGPTYDAATWTRMRRYADTNFGRIAYIDEGKGPAALFLHGFPLSGFQWRGAIARLKSVRRCIAPDVMGLGFTEPAADQSLVPMEQMAMLLTLLDKLQVGTVDLIANDSSSAIAQLLAGHHPDRVRSLLLTNGDTEPDCPPKGVEPVIALARENKFPETMLVPILANKALARRPEDLGGACYSKPGNPTDEALDLYVVPLASTAERRALTNRFARSLSENALAGIEARLRKVQAPLRVVWGAADTIFKAESPEYLNSVFPNAKGARRIPGAKLFFPEEYPDVIAEEARRLWKV